MLGRRRRACRRGGCRRPQGRARRAAAGLSAGLRPDMGEQVHQLTGALESRGREQHRQRGPGLEVPDEPRVAQPGRGEPGGRVRGCCARERGRQRLGLQRGRVRCDEEAVRVGGDGPPHDVLPRGPARDPAGPPAPVPERDAHPGRVLGDVLPADTDELDEPGPAAQGQPEDGKQPAPPGGGPRPGSPCEQLRLAGGRARRGDGPAPSVPRGGTRAVRTLRAWR